MAFRSKQCARRRTRVRQKIRRGRFILSVLVKRTYTLSMSGKWRCRRRAIASLPGARVRSGRSQLAYPRHRHVSVQARSDVIVKGHAYGYSGCRQFQAMVKVGKATKKILVQGERRRDNDFDRQDGFFAAGAGRTSAAYIYLCVWRP